MRLRAALAAALAAAPRRCLADVAAKRVSVSLDEDPEHRWDHIVAADRDLYREAIGSILSDPRLSKEVSVAREVLGNDFEAGRLLPGEQWAEARGIARELGLDAADIVMASSFYDVFAAADSPLRENACTGIVAQTTSGEILHGRNLDYSFAHALSEVALVVDFGRNSSVLFTAVTFGPTPTFNTAVRHGSFSVIQDERNRGSILTNIFDVVVLGRPAVFARIRQAVESLESFDDALKFFGSQRYSAASYFILGGTELGQGAVVTADRDRAADVWSLDADAGRWYVVETNYDHWTPAPEGDDRRHPVRRAMDSLGPGKIDPETMWQVLSITHVNTSAGERAPLNSKTIYSTFMQASNPKVFKTMVRSRAAEQLVV